MKKLIVSVFAVFLALNSVIAANTVPTDKKDPKTVSEQVAELLEAPQFKVTEEVTARVTFMVNKDQEIVVIDVDTTDEIITGFIKSRLNYEKLTLGKAGEQMILPVRIIPAS